MALTAVVALAAGLLPVASAVAVEPTDMVLVWNANAVSVISAAPTADPPGLGQPPPLSAFHLAMVHGAIYDAVNAIDGGHEPYLDGLSANGTESQAAAAAQAGHDVLYALVPAADTPANNAVRARIDGLLAASMLLIDPDPQSASTIAGRAIGTQAAIAIVADRAGDGRLVQATFPTSTDVGKWRPVPPLSNNVFAQFATLRPLTMKSPDQFPTNGPLDLRSPKYAKEFNEVKALGAQTGSSRTAAQTLLAGFVTANPLLFMNKGLRDLGAVTALSNADQARLFAKTSMASADALISCWNDKLRWGFWRPQTAIREAASDGNPNTAPDANWLSLFATPGYSDTPSGYNCYTAGFWQSARLFFGSDKMSFSLTSPGVAADPPNTVPPINPIGVAGSTRSYTRFTGVIDDTINGRILNGYHFRTTDVQGAWIGGKVAKWIDQHYFGVVH